MKHLPVLFALFLIGCGVQTPTVRQEVVVHDTVSTVIQVPGPVHYVSEGCNVDSILALYCNFDVDSIDAVGNYWQAKYRWAQHQLKLGMKAKSDTVLIAYMQKVYQSPNVWGRMKIMGQGAIFGGVAILFLIAWVIVWFKFK